MSDILDFGYLGLFVCGFLAGSIIPMNVEAPLCAAIALGWPVWNCLLFAWIGDWLGAASNYFLGMLASPEWIQKYCRVKKEKMERAQAFMQKHGVWLAALNFVPTIGNVSVLCLGIARAQFWKVFAILGACTFLRMLLVVLLTTGVIDFLGS